jgi:hypothetical protein
MKLEESKKKIEKRESRTSIIETNFVDVPYYIGEKQQNLRGVKNKMLIIKSDSSEIQNKRGTSLNRENFNEKFNNNNKNNKSLKNSNLGTLYKTHTFRKKFSDPNFIFEQFSLNAKFSDEKVNPPNNSYKYENNFEEFSASKLEKIYEIKEKQIKITKEKQIPNPGNKNSDDNEPKKEKIEVTERRIFSKESEKPPHSPNQKEGDINQSPKDHQAIYEHTDYSQIPPMIQLDSNMSEFKKKAYNPFKTASTIYTMLTKRKNEFISNIKKQNNGLINNTKFNQDDIEFIRNYSMEDPSKYKGKKQFMKRNPMTYYMDKKVIEDIPHVYPIVWIHQNDYENISEKNRYEKITQMFLKLRYYIENDEDNEKNYLKEFMMKNGIYEEKFYTIDKLNNFMNFLKSDSISQMNPHKTIQEVIIDATNYGEKISDDFSAPNEEKNSKMGKHERRKLNLILTNTNSSIMPSTKKYFGIEEDRFNMCSYLSHPQPILDEKKFKIKNEHMMIDKLEKEMERLRQGEGGLNFIVNETNLNINSNPKRNPLSKKGTLGLGGRKYEKTEKNEKITSTEDINREMNNDILPPVRNEIDIDLVKKKNKLLEYILLNRTRTRLLWNQKNSNPTFQSDLYT